MKLTQDTKPEHAFYCADGSVLKSLKELAEKLRSIGCETYAHHASEYRNDFYNWIKDVYCSEALARKVALAKSSAEAAEVIEKAISPPRKKKNAERKKTAVVKKRKARKRRRQVKKIKKASVVAAVYSTKKGKKKPTKKTRKKRKAKKASKRKYGLHRHVKTIARIFGLMK